MKSLDLLDKILIKHKKILLKVLIKVSIGNIPMNVEEVDIISVI